MVLCYQQIAIKVSSYTTSRKKYNLQKMTSPITQ